MAEPVYLPSNEPYLGRESVYQFEQVIISCLECNDDAAKYSRKAQLSDLQKAACQIIPQGVNLALTIRELVRQGYLSGALVLMRPLIERAAIISFLYSNPDEIDLWKDGWKHKERPSLAVMLDSMGGKQDSKEDVKKICDLFNHIVHGDPVGASWNLTKLRDGTLGYTAGKVTDDAELCDFICYQSYCYLIVLMGLMAACFPELHR